MVNDFEVNIFDFVPFADMIVYACYSGWRPSEITELEVADVDLDGEFIKGGIKTDSGKNRLVPIHYTRHGLRRLIEQV